MIGAHRNYGIRFPNGVYHSLALVQYDSAPNPFRCSFAGRMKISRLFFHASERYLESWDRLPLPLSTRILLFQFAAATFQSHTPPEGVIPMYQTIDEVTPTGISRRSFFRFAAGATTLASFPILTEAHLAYADRPKFADPNRGIHIDANENPMGPSEAARQAVINIVPRGGRYLFNIQEELTAIFAK